MRKLVLSLLLALATFATPAFAQTGTQTISTAGSDCSTTTNCAIFGVRGYPSIGVYINVGTSGTFVFEATTSTDPYDASAVWFGINDDIGDASSVTADGAVFFTNPGYAYVRIRASAISGDATAIAFPGFASLKSTATLSGASQGDGAIQDGSNNTIEASVLDLTNSNPLTVAITDSNGDQVSSFGGGTQYNTGDADATPTGTVSFGFDGTNVRALNVDSSGNLATLSTQLGSWTVTANAGTNLNTSSLLTTTAFNTVFGSASLLTTTQADNTANTTDGLNSSAFNYVFDGTTWDRWTGAVSQSGTWTVQPGNTANTTPWLFTLSQGGNSATVDANGALKFVPYDSSGTEIATVDATFGEAMPSTGPAMAGSDGANAQPFRVFDIDSGAGEEFAQGVILRKSASGGSVEFGTSSDPIRTDPTGSTTQPVSGAISISPVTLAHQYALSTTVQTVVTGAHTLVWAQCSNADQTAANFAYIQIFDVSGTVTLGTTVPDLVFFIPANSPGGQIEINAAFANAIKVAATTTATGSTAPATTLDCSFGYR